MVRLIVFDCDGVMFDSKKANIAYYNSLLDHFDCAPMAPSEEEFVHMHNVTNSISHIFRNHQDISPESIEEFRSTQSYAPFLKYMTIEPDLREFLDRVYPKCSLAISTNRTNTMIPLLEEYEMRHYFGMVMTAQTAPRPKPAPDGLLEILRHYGCTPDEAIFIGDSILDEQHAASCGVPLIAFRNPDLTAEYYVESFLQILELPPLQAYSV